LVRRQEAQAGAFSDDDYAALSEAVKSEFTILAQTEKLPRHLVSVRADLDPELAGRIETILLGMPDDEAGRRILEKLDRTTKFDRLPGGEAALKRRLLDSFFSPERR
jgi:ABC-type phosphate/phosphonate transport system substrate-binding protein